MVLFVHDEVVAEVDEDDADRVARLLETELARGMGARATLVAEATWRNAGATSRIRAGRPMRGPSPV